MSGVQQARTYNLLQDVKRNKLRDQLQESYLALDDAMARKNFNLFLINSEQRISEIGLSLNKLKVK